MPIDPHARRHRLANIVVVVVGVYALLAAVWSPPELYTIGGSGEDVAMPGGLFMAYVAGGVLALGAVVASMKWPALSKVMSGLGGLALLSGLLAMYEVTLLAAASLGLSGLALLAAAPFMGRMPTPEQEGVPRTGWGEPDRVAPTPPPLDP